MSDRVHVISSGQLSPSVPLAEATVEKIGEWMSGLWSNEVQDHLAEMELASAADMQGGQHVQA